MASLRRAGERVFAVEVRANRSDLRNVVYSAMFLSGNCSLLAVRNNVQILF